MPYPGELLPKNTYVGSINTGAVIDKHPLVFLLRRISNLNSEVKFKDLFPSGRAELYGYSTYIFGEYKIVHLRFRPSKMYEYWKKGDACLTSDQIEHNSNSNDQAIFLQLRDFYNIDFPINKQKDGKVTQTISAKLSAEHRPTLDNYWHFELVIRNETGIEISKEEAGDKEFYKRKAREFAEEIIMNSIEVDVPSEVQLNPQLYTTPE